MEAVLQKHEIILEFGGVDHVQHAAGALLGNGRRVADEEQVVDLFPGLQILFVEFEQILAHHVTDLFVVAHDLGGFAFEVFNQAVIDDQRDFLVHDFLRGVAQQIAFHRPKNDDVRTPVEDLIQALDLFGGIDADGHHVIFNDA